MLDLFFWSLRQSESDSAAAGDAAEENAPVPEGPDFVYLSREELLKEFPNAPEAPTRPPLNMNDFRQEDLISGNIDITYGGKVRVFFFLFFDGCVFSSPFLFQAVCVCVGTCWGRDYLAGHIHGGR